ncbi:alkaline phosphatase D family protein [Haloglomus litoreum]|uniref:alkaline phosphatase D family protein n=1 Tax=Haloglomus litoreum TaxID=3034026 RepID=UPI0023E8BA89|nr:alkaline phosphatase D family protein [Haloglomus sp. DT116]
MTDRSGDGTEHSTTRRNVLRAASAASAGAAAATLLSTGAVAEPTEPSGTAGSAEAATEGGYRVFPQSVASGGPTPSGAIVWTRVAPTAVRFSDADTLYLEVTAAPDRRTANAAADFTGATTYTLPAADLDASQDHTVNVDLDGRLDPDTFYFYRFVFDGATSPVGRLRTMPAPDASVDDVRLAVSSCNNYLHGYYGAFGHIAKERADYHVSLGDFLYEYAGAGQQPGRDIQLPSGKSVVHTLADYRHLHRTYRSDDNLRAAMERHTLIHTWDDHEIINNRWWVGDAETGFPDTRSHPFGGDPGQMRQLYARGIKAMLEYLPLRVEYDDPQAAGGSGEGNTARQYFRLYRSFKFGDLAELFMTDERLYRSPPPKDDDDPTAAGGRDLAPPSPERNQADLDRTMLGTEQYRWFLDGGTNPGPMPDTDGVTGTDATWKLHGNEVLCAALKVANAGVDSLYLNYDAWDGYEAERNLLMARLARDEVDNYVTLTGDMHSYVAGYLKQDYKDPQQSEYVGGSRVGIEFMTPGITSNNLASAGGLPANATEDAIDEAVRTQNPHIEWFNSSRWGYTTVHISDRSLTYTAYDVDRTVDSGDAPKQLLRSYRVPEGRYELQEFRSAPLDEVVGDQVAPSFAEATASDGPDVTTGAGPVDGTVDAVTGDGGDEASDGGSTDSDPDDTGTSTTGDDDDGAGIPDPVDDGFEWGI